MIIICPCIQKPDALGAQLGLEDSFITKSVINYLRANGDYSPIPVSMAWDRVVIGCISGSNRAILVLNFR